MFGILTITAVLTVQVQAQSFLTNGLVSYWPFNGNANDVTGNGNNGNLGTGIGFGLDRFGNTNSALYFTNGIGGQMTTTVLQPANNVFTIVEWFNLPTGYTNESPLICMMETQSGQNYKIDKLLQVGPIGGATTNNLNFYLFPGYQVYLPTPKNVADGHWHQAVATLSPMGMMLYLDGNLVATNSNTTASQGFTGYWRIMPGNGFVDDIRIYNRALATNEVAQLYAIESGPIINIQKAVYLTSSNLLTGSNYQLQVSTNVNGTFTNYGSVFNATTNYWQSTNYWNVANWNQLFFRLQPVP